MSAISDAIRDVVARSSRTFAVDRWTTVGASEIGQCLRKVWFTKAEGELGGCARDKDFAEGRGAAFRGQTIETTLFVPAMRTAYGHRARYLGDEQRTFTWDFLSATPDCLVVGPPEDFLVECKSIDPRTRLDGRPKLAHEFQVQVQMGLVRKCTKYRPARATIVYIDSAYWDRVIEFDVAFDERVYAQAHARARQVLTSRSPETLEREGQLADGRECEWCAFTTACKSIRYGKQRHLEQQIGDGKWQTI